VGVRLPLAETDPVEISVVARKCEPLPRLADELGGAVAAVLLNLFFNGLASSDEARAAARDNSHGSE
jgi:hypothetical protein